MNARAAVVLVLLAPALAGCAAPSPAAVVDGFDPAVPHCVGTCARVVDGSPARAWEPFVAVDPEDPDRIVIAHSEFPDGSTVGRTRISISEDGGASWDTRVVPSGMDEGPDHPLAPYTHVGWFPAVVFLSDGTLVMSASATNFATLPNERLRSMQTLYTTRSTDGGRTWGDVRIVDEGDGATGYGRIGVGQGKSAAEGALTVGRDGGLLLVWSQVFASLGQDPSNGGLSGRLVFSTSSDGGLTWAPTGIVDDENLGYGAQPIVGHDGGWRITYLSYWNDDLRFAESGDHGATWSLRTIGGSNVRPVMRAQTLASGVERLLVAFPNGSAYERIGEQTHLMWSDDGGATWTPPLVLDTPEGEGAPMPNVVGAGGDGAWVTHFDIDADGGSRYVAVKVVDGVVGSALILDEIDIVFADNYGAGRYMGLASTPSGDALAVWLTYGEDEYDLMSARLTGGDVPAARALPRPAMPAGLDEPIRHDFTGHVTVPYYCYDPDPTVEAPMRDLASQAFRFEVPPDTRFINGTLAWDTPGPTPATTDLDVWLYDGNGNFFDGVGSNYPDTFAFELSMDMAGTWTAVVQNCQNPPTDFTLEVVLE